MARPPMPLLLVLSLVLVGCGTERPPTDSSPGPALSRDSTSGPPTQAAPSGGLPAAIPTPSGEVITSATVLEKPGAGPQLCLGAIAASMPPQCGGAAVDNWNWATAPGFESAAGMRWATTSSSAGMTRAPTASTSPARF